MDAGGSEDTLPDILLAGGQRPSHDSWVVRHWCDGRGDSQNGVTTMGRVLVACEESQAVAKELRAIGIEAFSCDIEDCSGGHPEWHIQDDVIPLLKESWDMVLAFPPCTHLASSGARHFAQKRRDGRQQQGIDFFMRFAAINCKRVAIENPVGIMSNIFRKPDQIIHPWQFGHTEQKSTCLWLKGLPLLKATDDVKGPMMALPINIRQRIFYMSKTCDRSKQRSKTFSGIAKAIASQWGQLL